MMLGKRGEIDNKFLLIILIVVAVVVLGNNGFFTGRATRTVGFEAVQASGTPPTAYYPNVFTSPKRSANLVTNIQPTGGTQYATGGGGRCECPHNPSIGEFASDCSGNYPACGRCYVRLQYFDPNLRRYVVEGPVERNCV